MSAQPNALEVPLGTERPESATATLPRPSSSQQLSDSLSAVIGALSSLRPGSGHRLGDLFERSSSLVGQWTPIPSSLSNQPTLRLSPYESSRQGIPSAARAHYEKLYGEMSGGRQYLASAEAAGIFLQSGLHEAGLPRLWEKVDKDRNGIIDKEEFVQAMWMIKLHKVMVRPSPPQVPGPSQPASSGAQWNDPMTGQHSTMPLQPQYHQQAASLSHFSPQGPAHPPDQRCYSPSQAVSVHNNQHTQPHSTQSLNHSGPPVAEILLSITCKACGSGLGPADTAYRVTATCHSIEYFCTACPRHPAATEVLLIPDKAVPKRESSSVSCDGCWKSIKKNQMTWCCKKCWDTDLCHKCWGKRKRHCKHVATGQVVMMRVGKKRDGKEDDGNGGNGNDGDDDKDWWQDVVEGIMEIIGGEL